MKKIIAGVLVIAAFASCKKSHDNVSCEVSLTGIAATYKLTKIVAYFPAGLPDQDQTSSLSDCEKNATYLLKSDKTATYTETASCGGTDSGTWDIVDGKMTINSGSVDVTNANVSTWDCTTLSLSEDFGSGAGLRYTFSKQ